MLLFAYILLSFSSGRVVFNANGSAPITQCSGTDCTSPITYLVQGGITSPIPLTPAQPSPPDGYDATTCANVGKDQWEVTDVSYSNYTADQCKQWYEPGVICLDPAGDFKSHGDYLSIKVTNNAISHEVSCDFSASPNANSLPSPLRCTGGDFNEIILDITWTGTAPNFSLNVEQLWYCLENPSTNTAP